MLLSILVSTSFISSCSKPPDRKAYEEVVATMSMEKAKNFFHAYSKSIYRDKLVNEIAGWCEHEETEECYRMILDVLPQDHPRTKEMLAYYEKNYGTKR
ncbi:MAG: hypothetical protein AB1390_11110 [Nitrospirota bacterium]